VVTSRGREARERILEEGARLFAEKGFAATTVRDIATSADLNLAMIHYYFGNKEGLYRAIFEENVTAIHQVLAGAVSEGSARARLERFIRAYAHFICTHPHFARIVQQEILNGGKLVQEVFRPQVIRNYLMFRGVVEQGVHSGEFRPVDVEMTPISVIGMMAFFMIARPVISGVISPGPGHRDFEARLSEHTLSLLFHGILEQVEPSLTSNRNQPE
jgi:TetR/AcrR family transcriptional regulator